MVQKIKYKHFNKDMILTKDDEQNFKNADKCYICNKNYSGKDIRARDHCYITGSAEDQLIKTIILIIGYIDKIPVICHNLRGYDSHIMQTIGEIANTHTYKNKKREEKQMDINVI